MVGAFERQSLSGCVLLQYMFLSNCLEDNASYCTRGWVEYAPCRGWFDQIPFSRIVESRSLRFVVVFSNIYVCIYIIYVYIN